MTEELFCRVDEFDDDETSCSTVMEGYELPGVGFPTQRILDAGLTIGDWFIWNMTKETIVKTDPPKKEEIDHEEYDRLMVLHHADREPWPEFHEDGE